MFDLELTAKQLGYIFSYVHLLVSVMAWAWLNSTEISNPGATNYTKVI